MFYSHNANHCLSSLVRGSLQKGVYQGTRVMCHVGLPGAKTSNVERERTAEETRDVHYIPNTSTNRNSDQDGSTSSRETDIRHHDSLQDIPKVKQNKRRRSAGVNITSFGATKYCANSEHGPWVDFGSNRREKQSYPNIATTSVEMRRLWSRNVRTQAAWEHGPRRIPRGANTSHNRTNGDDGKVTWGL